MLTPLKVIICVHVYAKYGIKASVIFDELCDASWLSRDAHSDLAENRIEILGRRI